MGSEGNGNNKKPTLAVGFLLCIKRVKRCLSRGKNEQKVSEMNFVLFYVVNICSITVYINTIVEYLTGNMYFFQNIKHNFFVYRS